MSRSGYTDDCGDVLEMGRWRGVVASSLRGKRGQKFLHDLIIALDKMTDKRLIRNELKTENGEVCALGALGIERGIDMCNIDPEDQEVVAKTFDISEPLASEVVYLNDEFYDDATPERRWELMREWAEEKLNENRE